MSSALRLPVSGALLALFLVGVRSGLPLPAAPAGAHQQPVAATGRLADQLARIQHPPPIEHWLDEGVEQRNKKARKAWFEAMHRAAPGTDWRAIERRNGLAETARRRTMLGAPPATHGSWTERGSDNQAGRMMVARVAPDGETLYAGSSKGGVWHANLDGVGWTPIGDNLYGGAAWLEVMSPDGVGDPPIVVAATDGGLIHRSVDDGESWEEVAGLDDPWSIRRLAMKSDGSELLFMVAEGDSGSFLYRSSDKGASWEAVYDLEGFNGDAWLPRDGGGAVWLATSSQLLRSDDDGESWTAAGDLPGMRATSAELAGSEAGAPAFWLALNSTTLYRSGDAGASWTSVTSLSDYWSVLTASSVDTNRVAWGGVEVSYTTDGRRFDTVNDWWDYYDSPSDQLHADVMGMDAFPDGEGGETWYICTDGGLYRSTDGLATVENLSLDGLRVSQYYDTLTSSADPTHVAAGAQDQGYQVTNTMTQDEDDPFELEQIISGDYGQLTSSDGSHAYVYSTYPGFILIQAGEDDPALYSADFPSGESYVPWIPPVIADPDDRRAFFFPATRLYRYSQVGSTWVPSTYGDHEFDLSSGEYVTALQFSPLDSDRVYAATSYGRAWYSADKGLTWTQSVNRVADDNWYYGQAIVASNTDIDTVYIGGSGYSVPAVYRSTDGGFTFEPWGDGLPDTLVYSLCEASDGSGVLVAGTETGAWRRDPGDEEWWEITGTDAPVTTYWSCEALADEDSFRFGTYGRGMWDYHFIYEPDVGDTGGGDTGVTTDGGTVDGGAADGGSPDGGSADGGSPDGGSTDGGGADGGSADGGGSDGGVSDGGASDGGASDGGASDGGAADGGSGGGNDTGGEGKGGGCACGGGGGAGLLALSLSLLAPLRRRRA